MAKKSSASPDVDSLLRGLAMDNSKSKKSDTPFIDVDDDTKKRATKFRNLKTEIEDKTAEMKEIGADLLGVATPLRRKYCLEKEFTSSIRIPTNDGMTLTIVYGSNFIKCPPTNEESIINFIGKKRYEEFFAIKNTIKGKDDLSKDELKDLITTLGVEKFKKYFNVEQNIKPNSRFNTVEGMRTFSEDEIAELELLGVKQYEPGIKK